MHPIAKASCLGALLIGTVVAALNWHKMEKVTIQSEIKLGMRNANWEYADSPAVKEIKEELFCDKVRNSPSLQNEIRMRILLGQITNDARFWNHSPKEAEEDAKFAAETSGLNRRGQSDKIQTQQESVGAEIKTKNIAAQAAAQTLTDTKQKQLLIETQKDNEFNLGFDAGIKMQKVYTLNRKSDIHALAITEVDTMYPKLKSFPYLRDSYVSGFEQGYKTVAKPENNAPQASAQSGKSLPSLRENKPENPRYDTRHVTGYSSHSFDEALHEAEKQMPRNGVLIGTKQYMTPHLAGTAEEYVVENDYKYQVNEETPKLKGKNATVR
jgi:hypothetical protein